MIPPMRTQWSFARARLRITLPIGLALLLGSIGLAPAAPASAALTAREVREAEALLAGLGYWTGPVDGRFDEVSRQALIAFQKADWRRIDGRLTARELVALRRALPVVPREVSGELHLEVDLLRQILFTVAPDGRVSRILPISSGNGKPFKGPDFVTTAETPCGRFTVFQKLAGLRKSPLGEMYDPLYIVGGIAIHGSPSVPFYPASHGCIRIPMFASKPLFHATPLETPVLVYGCKT